MNNNSGGISFWGVLQIVFNVLKVCGVIDWSWFFVLLPLICYVLLLGFLYWGLNYGKKEKTDADHRRRL